MKAFVEILNETSYEGPLTIEMETSGEQLWVDVEKDASLLRAIVCELS